MKLTRAARITLSLIALFAMAWVHVFKPARGFECDLDGHATYTLQDHCHGADSGPCHHDEDDLPADEDTHHHTALIESLLALKADSSQFACIPSAAPVILTVISLPSVVPAEHSEPRHIAVRFDDRRWPRILSRTIVLRV